MCVYVCEEERERDRVCVSEREREMCLPHVEAERLTVLQSGQVLNDHTKLVIETVLHIEVYLEGEGRVSGYLCVCASVCLDGV